ncbi:MAG: ABC transporter permease subunit [Chloroflexi bacterium]|nr:ABC transporter permease subunit [Chloroflexota bacterium]
MKQALLRNTAVLTKELRTRMRGRRAAIVITVYLLLLAGIGALMLYIQQGQLQYGYSMSSVTAMGTQVFAVLSLLQLFLVVFIVPGLTGSAIAGERDKQTLDLLLGTQVSSLGIVLGKILSSLSYVFILLMAALPIFSLAFLFGGVSPRQVGLSFVISLASALMLGTIGVFLSVLVRRGQVATVLAYTVTFLLLIGTAIASVFIGTAVRSANDTAMLLPLVLNPMAALGTTLTGIFPSAVLSLGGPPGSGLALWQANLIADAVLVAVFLFLATRLLRPGQSRLFRRRQAVAPAEAQT